MIPTLIGGVDGKYNDRLLSSYMSEYQSFNVIDKDHVIESSDQDQGVKIDDINIEISSLRGMIGELEREIRELKDALRFSTSNIGITTYNTGNDMNAGINTTPVTTYTVGQIQINAFN